MVFYSEWAALSRQERIALPSELAGESGSRLDPKSLREERDHLVTALAWGRCCRWTVITPRLASIQVLFLKAVLFFGSGRRHHQGGSGGGAGFVIRAVFPKGEQQHGEFAGDGDDGAFLLPRAAGAGETPSVFAQRAGRAEGAQDVMRGADEQAAHQTVTALADAQLFVGAPALVAAGTQTQIRPNVPPAPEPLRVADLQDEAQRGERADAGNLLEPLRGGILLFTALHQVVFHPLDLFGDVGEDSEQGLNHRQTIRRDVGQRRFVKRFAGGVAHRMAETLEGEADGVDEVDAGADEGIAQFEAEQIVLGLGRAVLDGMQ